MQSVEELITTVTDEITTHQSTQYDRTIELDWIFPVFVNISLTIANFWFLFSLIHYGIKHKMWQQTRNHTDVLNTGLVYASVIGCAVACNIRLVTSFAQINIGFSNVENELCKTFAAVSSMSYGIEHLFVSIFLWSRQRSFFENRLLNFNYSRPVKYFSTYVIVFIVGFITFAFVYAQANIFYTSSEQGCILSVYKPQIEFLLLPILAVMFYNVALLGLLFYALTRAKSFQEREPASSTQLQNQHFQDTNSSRNTINTTTNVNISYDSINFNSAKNTSSTENYRPRHKSASNLITAILQKTLLFAILSICIDVLIHLFNAFLSCPNSHRRIFIMSFDIATFFNLILVLLSFAARKEMMMSPCR